jgi:two-component system sensor histidine kinase AlgZ
LEAWLFGTEVEIDPFLEQPHRLALYFLAWTPLAVLLVYLIVVTAKERVGEAAALAVPLCVLYAMVCLSAWYPCRGTPLERSSFVKLMKVHFGGGLVATGSWILGAEGMARGLESAGYFVGIAGRVPRIIPLLAGTGIVFYLFAVNFWYVMQAMEMSREAEARAMQARELTRESELRALKAQVNPHFLFNSLNSISALTSSDAARAREMCVLLGDFLRRTLGLGEKASIPLEDELSLVHAFLAVEKIRYGARLQIKEEIGNQCLDLSIPPLLLQPLVENAVGHGIANLVEGGCVRVGAESADGQLLVTVENPYDPEAPARRRNGVGIANVRRRLDARYGERASMGVTTENGWFRVALRLPAEKSHEGAGRP